MSELWPPQWKNIKKCPQYRCGMINRYIEEWDLEKFEHLDDEAYFGPRCIGKSSGKAHQKFKDSSNKSAKAGVMMLTVFLRPCCDLLSFRLLCLTQWRRKLFIWRVMKSTCFAVKEINAQAKKHSAGTRYELKDLEKIVETRHLCTLLTFTVKEFVSCSDADSDVDDGHVVKTVQAMVYTPPGLDLELKEWRFKPAELLDSAEVSPESSDAAQVSHASQGSDASDKSP